MSDPVIQPGRPTATASVQLTDRIVRVLRTVRGRHLRTRLAEFPVWLGIVLPLIILGQALADWVFDLPWTTRRNLLCADAAVVIYFFVRHIAAPYYKRLSLHDATLLIERKVPQFRTSLISAVELTANPDTNPALLKLLVRQVDGLVENENIARRVVQTTALKKRFGWTLLVLFLVGGLTYYFQPKSLFLGRRILLSHEGFPRRTKVFPLTKGAVVPEGADFSAMARAEGVIPKDGRIVVLYDDGRQETAPVVASKDKPDIFAFSLKNVRQPFRYRFALNDGVGEDYRVTTRTLLASTEVHFIQTYPAHTGLPKQEMSPGNLALLAGGRMWLRSYANKPLKSATLTEIGPGKVLPMQILGDKKNEANLDLFLEKNGMTAFTIHFEGVDSEQSENDPVYQVELTVDKPPVVTIKIPREDKITSVTSDKVPMTFTVRDDFGIKKIEMVYEIFHLGTNEELGAAEKGRVPLDQFAPDATGVRSFTWDLAKLIPPLSIGYSANFWIEASDNDSVFGPNIGRSKKKTLTVVSEDTKKIELIEALGKKATEIEQLYNLQRKLNQQTDSTLQNPSANP